MKKGVRIAAIFFLGAIVVAILFFTRGNNDIFPEKKFNGARTYIHPRLGFSLNYPKNLALQELEEDGAEIVVFSSSQNERVSSDSEKIGFQMYIIPFEGEGVLTRERILEDIPGAVVDEPITVLVNPSAPSEERVSGLVFWSEQAELGRTRELWFIHGGYLYEVTAYAHLDAWLAQQMDSLRFR